MSKQKCLLCCMARSQQGDCMHGAVVMCAAAWPVHCRGVPDVEAWPRQLQWPLALIVDGKSVASTKARCVPWPTSLQSVAPMFDCQTAVVAATA